MRPKEIIIIWGKEDKGYICKILEFPYLSVFGKTPEEALKEGLIVYEGIKEIYKEEAKLQADWKKTEVEGWEEDSKELKSNFNCIDDCLLCTDLDCPFCE